MKIIIDTNVFISGIFFSGPPYQILKEWHAGRIEVVISPGILEEYLEVGKELAKQFPKINFARKVESLLVKAVLINAPALPEQICSDADDDKFLACALACGGKIIVSGDKHLLKISGYQGIEVLKPRPFVDQFLI